MSQAQRTIVFATALVLLALLVVPTVSAGTITNERRVTGIGSWWNYYADEVWTVKTETGRTITVRVYYETYFTGSVCGYSACWSFSNWNSVRAVTKEKLREIVKTRIN